MCRATHVDDYTTVCIQCKFLCTITSSVAAVSPTSQPSAGPGLIEPDTTPIRAIIGGVIRGIVIAVWWQLQLEL